MSKMKVGVDDGLDVDGSKLIAGSVPESALAPGALSDACFMTMITNSTATTFTAADVPAVVLGDAFKANFERSFSVNTSSGKITHTASDSDAIKIDVRFSAVKVTSSRNCSFYIAIGNDDDNDITAFADAGGGQVTVTTENAHGLPNGTRVCLNGTTNYNGTFTIASVTTNGFDITDTWVSDDATGNWALVEEDSVVSRLVDTSPSSISLLFVQTLTQNSYMYLLAENNENTDVITLNKLHFAVMEL